MDNRTATANSTAKITPAIASGQKVSLGVLLIGLYCRTLNPVPGRRAIAYRCPRGSHTGMQATRTYGHADTAQAKIDVHTW
jgi:hypothetical protein